MQQRQPRLGDILDDYCPRERRLTNHVVVAMIGDDVKQTRCTTCDADHEYKHATIPRQRKKPEESALYAQVLAGVTPKRIVPPPPPAPEVVAQVRPVEPVAQAPVAASASGTSRNPVADFDALFQLPEADAAGEDAPVEENISHRRLIRAQLPRHEGQAGITRQATDFTIRQPNPGRPKRFGARPARGGAPFQGVHQGRATGNGNGNSSGHAQGNGNGNGRGPGGQRQGGRPQGGSRPSNRPGGGGGGRNRSR